MKIIFMGRKKYAAEMLQWTIKQGIEVALVCTDSQFSNSPTADMARKLGLPVVSMEEAEEYVASHKDEIDLVVSYLYWRKIRKILIDSPKYGCINFHPAILPDWRGTAGYNIAILNKLQEWGATAHYVSESIDMGEIIKVYKFNFDYRIETAYSLEKKTQNIQMELYKSVILDVLEKGRLESIPQKKSEGTYISKKEMIEMMKVDLNNLESEDLDLKIRAFWFPPYDGAGFEVNGKFYTLVNREILKTLQNKDATAMI
jgi:methionyl-tRNA formyltransferase